MGVSVNWGLISGVFKGGILLFWIYLGAPDSGSSHEKPNVCMAKVVTAALKAAKDDAAARRRERRPTLRKVFPMQTFSVDTAAELAGRGIVKRQRNVLSDDVSCPCLVSVAGRRH